MQILANIPLVAKQRILFYFDPLCEHLLALAYILAIFITLAV